MTKLKYLLFLFLFIGKLASQPVVLITGAGGGIGHATAIAFQNAGWKVWKGYHKIMPLIADAMGIDVTDEKSIQAAIDRILLEDGRIDVLINNAGYGLIGAEECVTIEEAQKLFDVNFFGPLRMIQAVLPTMRKQQSGHIINISSGVGVNAFPGLGIYSASKFALEGMSESLAATVAPFGVKVALVEPGFVNNNWGNNCAIGSRPCNEEVYTKLTQAIRNMLYPRGQSNESVAALLLEIAQNPDPDLRYQTTKEMKAYIGEKLVDPSGNITKVRNAKFVNQLLKS